MEAMVRAFKLGPQDVERISAAPNEPRHHTFEELIIGPAGLLEHFIDFRSKMIHSPFVDFVIKSHIHHMNSGVMDANSASTLCAAIVHDPGVRDSFRDKLHVLRS